jgi:hypothetical protein
MSVKGFLAWLPEAPFDASAGRRRDVCRIQDQEATPRRALRPELAAHGIAFGV